MAASYQAYAKVKAGSGGGGVERIVEIGVYDSNAEDVTPQIARRTPIFTVKIDVLQYDALAAGAKTEVASPTLAQVFAEAAYDVQGDIT